MDDDAYATDLWSDLQKLRTINEGLVKALERAGAHLRKLAYSHGADEDEADEAVAYITAALKAADAES
jgi:hypothetical protein